VETGISEAITPRPSFSSSLHDPLAAGHALSRPAPDQQAEHHQQGTTLERRTGSECPPLRDRLKQPFDDADGCQQSTSF